MKLPEKTRFTRNIVDIDLMASLGCPGSGHLAVNFGTVPEDGSSSAKIADDGDSSYLRVGKMGRYLG